MCGFLTIFRIKSDFFHKNINWCFLCGLDSTFKYYLDEFSFKGLAKSTPVFHTSVIRCRLCADFIYFNVALEICNSPPNIGSRSLPELRERVCVREHGTGKEKHYSTPELQEGLSDY
jgi:hypothetical protein